MSLESLKQFLLLSTLLNYSMVTIWFLLFWRAHNRLYRLHRRWFCISVEQFDAIHYAGMAFYKIAVLLLNLMPLLALHWIS